MREAAELSDDGNLFVRLGQVQMQQEEWETATALFQKAIAKGALDKPGNALLLLGISYYNDGSAERARSSFAKASEHDSTRKQASQWIDHMDREARAS